MRTDPKTSVGSLRISGKIRVSCGDTRFTVDLRPDRAIVDFPSFSQLLKMRSEVDSLRASISRLPPLPGSINPPGQRRYPVLPEFRLTVRDRSIGKLEFRQGGVHFHLTPFDFITRRMS